MNKSELRKHFLQKRKNLLPDEKEELSQSVLNHFTSLSFASVNYLHIFYPIIGKHEFNSLLLVAWLKEQHPQINIVLPKSNLEDHSLHSILWQNDTPLAVNQWGITEPETGIEVLAEQLDMIIIPLLAFDTSGNRLGYGKGFYDRFLSTCRPNVQKLGISLFEPEQQFEELSSFDVPLDICITPAKIWKFDGK